MKHCLIFLALFFCSMQSNAQMTLAHTFSKPIWTEGQIVNVGTSGKKIMTLRNECATPNADTLFFYNLDYSFWKQIVCPAIPGKRVCFNLFHEMGQGIGVHYPSENLFNLDTFVEVAVFYGNDPASSSGSPIKGNMYIINENGVLTDSIIDVLTTTSTSFKVYRLGAGSSTASKAVVSTTDGVRIYDLPGNLPCESCDGSGSGGIDLGLHDAGKSGIQTQPTPNPSSDQVKITFELPEGVNKAELRLFTTTGQVLKTFKIDNRFGFLMLDNSSLAPGMYYYEIITNTGVVGTQRMLVVK